MSRTVSAGPIGGIASSCTRGTRITERDWRVRTRRNLAIALACLGTLGIVMASDASAANTNYIAPVYSNPWNPSASFVGVIAPYVGVNVYCWTDASRFGDSRGYSTNRWFSIRWWNVWHWLYGYTPAMYINNQPAVGHC